MSKAPQKQKMMPTNLRQRYVLGFAFHRFEISEVLLIKKTHPSWQKDCFNGVGGRVEEHEVPVMAMVREFHEEAGIKTTMNEWNPFACLTSPTSEVFCFHANLASRIHRYQNNSEEKVRVCSLLDALQLPLVADVAWLLLLAHEARLDYVYASQKIV